MNEKSYIYIIIAFVLGAILSYFNIYHIGQEDETYTVDIDSYYEYCNKEFFIKDYINGLNNNFDLNKLIEDIEERCYDN